MEFFAKEFNELSSKEMYEILKSRAEIFLLEQNIVCQDMDDADFRSLHCFLWDGKRAVAYLRAFPTDDKSGDVLVGRVLTLCHKNGMGTQLMERSFDEIKMKFNPKKIKVHAQTQAVGFYEKFGFKPVSEEYMEEGIPHITMEKSFC